LKQRKEIVIIGAGISGICAALSCAEEGCNVTLIEKSETIGGNVIQANVGTICGAYLRTEQSTPNLVGNSFVQQFITDLLSFLKLSSPINYHQGLHIIPYDWEQLNEFLKLKLKAFNNITLQLNTAVTAINVSQNKIKSIALNSNEKAVLYADEVIDCSGNTVANKLLGLAVISEKKYQSATQLFRINNIGNITEFALNMRLKKMVAGNVKWPKSYQSISVSPLSLVKDRVDIKLTLPHLITDKLDAKALKKEAEKAVNEVFAEMRQQIDCFKTSRLQKIFPEVGVRVQNRAKGVAILEENDVLNISKPKNGIAIGAWPIEYWNPEGKLELTTFEQDEYYLIPAGCLQSKDIENLYYAGKNISASEKAIASARVVGTCLQTAFAAGKMASKGINVISELRNNLMIGDEYI